MPERPRPDIDHTREALRQHDERTSDDPAEPDEERAEESGEENEQAGEEEDEEG